MEKRWREVMQYWQKDSPYWLLPGFAIGLIAGLLIGWSSNIDNWFIDGFWAEALGIVITVGLIDTFNRLREATRKKDEQRQQLIRQVGNRDNAMAVAAIKELTARGWLSETDNTLSNQDLYEANLQGVNLNNMNLSNSNISGANLSFSQFWRTNLERTRLLGSNFTNTFMIEANLREARLEGANLQNANLALADLSGANLAEAKLDKCILVIRYGNEKHNDVIEVGEAKFDENSILPDGTRFDPSQSIFQLARFGCVVDPELAPRLYTG